MKVAVLGSNSFSGSDFIDLLLQETDANIMGLSRSPEKSACFLPYKKRESSRFRFHQADLTNETEKILELLDGFQPSHIVNFAAQSEVGPSWEHPDHWMDTNITALSRLASALCERRYISRYVHISSPEIYGPCPIPITEDAPVNPSTPYAVSKAAADMLLDVMCRFRRLPLVTVRATNVYGAHQQLFKLIPRSVIYIRKGRLISLHGGGRAVKSYIHIRDVSRGTMSVMTEGEVGGIYHLSPDTGAPVHEVVRMICNLMGKRFESVTETTAERLAQDAAYVIDSSLARKKFGWAPTIGFEDGLKGVVEWVDQNWTTIQAEPLEYIHAR